MRIWTVHPQYLDVKGLVACWRETLLAQKVLMGQTKGYKNHAQLERWKLLKDPVAGIGTYLHHVHLEAVKRGYSFNESKILRRNHRIKLKVTEGQVDYEVSHLAKKLEVRDYHRSVQLLADESGRARIDLVHPMFRVVPGDVATWEKMV